MAILPRNSDGSLEHAARILLAARTLGRVSRLTREQVEALDRMRGNLFV
jgi:hypothetical protein